VSPLPPAAGEGPGRSNIMAVPTYENLLRLTALLESGAVRVPIQDRFAFDRAPAALTTLVTNHTQGKLAIAVTS
jgi:NADPH:quinone reductase-like Zn-dependent oxidoreductase